MLLLLLLVLVSLLMFLQPNRILREIINMLQQLLPVYKAIKPVSNPVGCTPR